MLNLISHQPDIDEIYLYAKNPYEAKYQLLIKKQEGACIRHFNDSEAFTKYSNDMDDIHKNIKEHNPNKKQNILIPFHDMIADVLSNIKRIPVVTELLIRGRKLNIALVFVTSYQKILV